MAHEKKRRTTRRTATRRRTKSRRPTSTRRRSPKKTHHSLRKTTIASAHATSHAVSQSFVSGRGTLLDTSRPKKTWEAPWLAIKNYNDLVYVNSEFILGRIEQSPYHFGPLDAESKPLVDDLLTLHRYGAVTIDSQPALLMQEPAQSRARRGRFYEARQKPYLVFFMPNAPPYTEAINAMYSRPGIFAVSITNLANDKWSSNFDEPIIVTEERDAPSAATIDKKRFRAYSSFKPDNSTREAKLFDRYPNIVDALKSTSCVAIASVLPFGRGNIIKAVINAFNALQIQPMYNVAAP